MHKLGHIESAEYVQRDPDMPRFDLLIHRVDLRLRVEPTSEQLDAAAEAINFKKISAGVTPFFIKCGKPSVPYYTITHDLMDSKHLYVQSTGHLLPTHRQEVLKFFRMLRPNHLRSVD